MKNDLILNKQLPLINYLKALAIVCVILIHSKVRIFIISPYLINLAVPLFIFIMGFNYSNSFIRKGYNKISELYNTKELIKKFLKFSIPYFICTFCLSVSDNLFFLIDKSNENGRYFFVLIVQLLFIIPLLFYYIKKNLKKSLIILFFLYIFYEIFCTILITDYDLFFILKSYKFMVLRYILLVGFGIAFSLDKDFFKSKFVNILSFLFGIICIFILHYLQPNMYPFFMKHNLWNATESLSVFYIFPVIRFLYFKNIKFKGIFHTVLTLIGNASWYIFLVQMVYFGMFPCYKINGLSFSKIILNIFICVVLGVLFYNAVEFVTHKISQNRR